MGYYSLKENKKSVVVTRYLHTIFVITLLSFLSVIFIHQSFEPFYLKGLYYLTGIVFFFTGVDDYLQKKKRYYFSFITAGIFLLCGLVI